MQAELRQAFNTAFREENHRAVLDFLLREAGEAADFRVSETPIFLSASLTEELTRAAGQVLDQLLSAEALAASRAAVPEFWRVEGESALPTFVQVDFALAEGPRGGIVPRLIELQGFPSLYGFQWLLARAYEACHGLPPGLTPYFDGLDADRYAARFKRVLLGNADPAETVLLEIDPAHQKTRIDFAITAKLAGIEVIDARAVRRRGKQLVRERAGREVPIRRVYSRVIFDELERKGLGGLRDLFVGETEVDWVGHPNWYFRISKYSLPSLRGEYVPPCHFVGDLGDLPPDLENYVLKPIFSFAGLGVDLAPTRERIASLADPANYILQRRVDYAACIETPAEPAKAEIRMMFLRADEGRPRLVNSLVRLSKGKMMGVDFNKYKTWVGSSVALRRA
jgi:hypothetical protein